MKKLALAVILTATVGSLAFAASVNIPLILDSANTTWTNGTPGGAGEAGFIRLKNTTTGSVSVTYRFFDKDGTERSPIPNTPAVMAPLQGWASRAVVVDSVQESASEQLLPKKNGGSAVGSVTIEWTGGANDIQGTVMQVHANGQRTQFSLPDGLP
ncbi:MAG: hypothetical protein HY706_02530 [Candidatus Hydrogenedentes bacterium]|nr:hypothetical protein [Candidatus Hydrogenedentota bacterium]